MRSSASFIGLSLGLFVPSVALAGDWKATISQDRVHITNGKMTIEEFSLCKVRAPGTKKSSVQMRTFAEAPVNAGISRDFFVAFHAATRTTMVVGMGSAFAKGTTVDALKALDCDPTSAPIGKVDVEINLYMTGEGFQTAIVDGTTGKTSQNSTRWEDAFADK